MPGAPDLGSPAEALLAPRIESRIVPGLDRIRAALDALGRPDRGFPSALVLGTNGKGSTAALLASVLAAHGLRVGLYTSPHLLRVEERIRVADAPISAARLLELIRMLARFPELSYFEALTTAALVAFADARVDVAVLEAGLGGRWDATNAVDSEVGLLTNVGTDHQAWLGDTREAIAAEKAAALRGRLAIVGSWDDEIERAIRSAADPVTPISLAGEWARVVADADDPQHVHFALGAVTGAARLPLAGAHQRDNLGLALAGAAALARLGLTPALQEASVAAGIEAVRWPGRLQRLEWRRRRLLLDGAHNREAIAALIASLEGRPDLVFSCLSDKPVLAMAAILRPAVGAVHLVALDSPRAMPLAELAAAFPGARTYPSVAAAMEAVPAGGEALITGSLRLIGAALAVAGEQP